MGVKKKGWYKYMSLIRNAIKVAREYYDDTTYQHVMRVVAYTANDNLIPDDKKDNCIVLAIMHDLLEDTEFDLSTFSINYYLEDCLKILTKDSKSTYEEYIKNIKERYTNRPEAYWVKLADIKDHLCQTETLTDKLKEKYLFAIPYLL